MNEKIFQEKYLNRIKKTLDFAINNKFSDFYRNKYKNLNFNPLNLKSFNDFKRLPLLSKEEIISIPIKDRTFIDNNNIAYYSFSSGTTNAQKPLILPQSNFNHDLILKYVIHKNEIVKKHRREFLVLLPPTSPPFIKIMSLSDKNFIPIPGDIKNLKITSIIIKELEIKSIITTPTILENFANELEKINFDFNSVLFISLAGELCSKQRLQSIKETFKNAEVVFRYGKSESGGPIGYRCEHIDSLSPAFYHPIDLYFFEINKAEHSKDGSGEIIHTDLSLPKGFPLIRYLTDDIASIKRDKCKCGESYTIKLGGRNNFDFLKFNGVVLYTESIERALVNIKEYLEPRFQMHVYEEKVSRKILPQLKLKVQLKDSTTDNNFLGRIINEINNNLYLAPKKNLQYFVDNNIFLPLEVEIVDKWSDNDIKTKNIVSHIE